MDYFFDSYAIIEIFKDSPEYVKFKDLTIFTNTLNLSEVYYYFLRKTDEQTANEVIDNLDLEYVQISKEIAIAAAKLRFELKDREVSFADCIGYISALKNSLMFLTGDEQFKNKDNVKFVK